QSAELYDPARGTWSATGNLANDRFNHTATLLRNGKVLVVGGAGNGETRAELYDPASGRWTATGKPNIERHFHTATLLSDGRVLVAGGYDDTITHNPTTSAELYDPATGAWTSAGSLADARAYHTAALLPNGEVLVAGGFDRGTYLASTE